MIDTSRFFKGYHSSCAVIGAQWGDEGKGKIVDVLAEEADIVVRYQGGDNAGHTVVSNGEKTVLHVLPSGAIRGKTCVLGRGMVINPSSLLEDIEKIEEKVGEILIDWTAPVITPFHIALDEPKEEEGEIGTTSRGIGPTYGSFVRREGLRFVDFKKGKKDVGKKVQNIANNAYLQGEGSNLKVREVTFQLLDDFEKIYNKENVRFLDGGSYLRDKLLDRSTKVLFEGAQGTMLDIGLGNYPYVTSSHPTAGGIAPGCGVSPDMVDHTVGITKAYTTRVGNGPFLAGQCTSEKKKRSLREKGNEFGATTGRPRKCGWLDFPALKYACQVNGFDELVMTKLDVLSGEDKIYTLSSYELSSGNVLKTHSPHQLGNVEEMRMEDYSGWEGDITSIREFSNLPPEAMSFVSSINGKITPPINVLSVGPDREETFEW